MNSVVSVPQPEPGVWTEKWMVSVLRFLPSARQKAMERDLALHWLVQVIQRFHTWQFHLYPHPI